MVDEFRPDNGATRFLPGSHHQTEPPQGVSTDPGAEHPEQALACGPAGSLLIFNGSTWHGHTANSSDRPRRSLQGFFVPRTGQAATDFGVRMLPQTGRRLSPLARYLLAIEDVATESGRIQARSRLAADGGWCDPVTPHVRRISDGTIEHDNE
jgi:ectoine hydroxylase-related dioxygenase (phytanoyl-CoA dioxygenase family)